VSLNPFAREPSSFSELTFVDRTQRLDTLLMPHLTNMIAVTNLKMMKQCKTREEAAVTINKLFQYPQTNIL